MLAQYAFNLAGGAIASAYPDDLGWLSTRQGRIDKVGVLADQYEAMFYGEIKNFMVWR